MSRTVPVSMRAAVLAGPADVRIEEVVLPRPGPSQVRVRLQGSGLCASNIPAYEGREWFTYPMPPGDLGHEGWGVVDAVGEDVTQIEPGQRVAMLSFRAYAEYDVADATHVVPLPAALDDTPFPGEALGCVMNIFRRAGVEAGHTVAIVGVGFLGAALVQLCAKAGARVIAVARSEAALDLARRCGAAHALPMHDHATLLEQVGALTQGRQCERTFECTGKPWPLDLAGEFTGVRGRLVIAGYHQDGLRQVNVQLWNWRGIDVVNAHERDPAVAAEGIRDAVDAVLDGRLDLSLLVSHRYPLERTGEALEAVRTRPGGFTKAVLLMEDPS
ncbi:zinc-binding dehydrogenase [Luteibacter sp. 329MFSha]|uniref:MDR/zinc-dependent alcohol dehydrogenase-like family protein n=1 Tax=Luteibacter sp. 329MFSha TaxID=1798239 RepID=UPI0008C46734|nr:zinc-binding dehydrogenase [Luteibacter sp. 329MFSha]SEV93552.1 Threonine dehydrogenase [Luteibacter sp. 329MFSha]